MVSYCKLRENDLKRDAMLNSKSVFRTAKYWRMRGEEVRTIAEGVRGPTAKKSDHAQNR
jgi:hypothetical protein